MGNSLDALARLMKQAQALQERALIGPRVPPLTALTDPVRSPSALALAHALPPGSALIVRHFGQPNLADLREARVITYRRGVLLLIAADLDLAAALDADGVHVPERLLRKLGPAAATFPLFSTSAHSARALQRAGAYGADMALVSPVFPSLSPSAGPPLGRYRLKTIMARATTPVIALGGINQRNVKRLNGTGVCGIAVVGAAQTAYQTIKT